MKAQKRPNPIPVMVDRLGEVCRQLAILNEEAASLKAALKETAKKKKVVTILGYSYYVAFSKRKGQTLIDRAKLFSRFSRHTLEDEGIVTTGEEQLVIHVEPLSPPLPEVTTENDSVNRLSVRQGQGNRL